MKQTAVEFLELMFLRILSFNSEEQRKKYKQTILQAKEIEKQQKGYSEEEVVQLLQKALTHQDDGEIGSLVTAQKEIRTANFYSWFNKFKNK